MMKTRILIIGVSSVALVSIVINVVQYVELNSLDSNYQSCITELGDLRDEKITVEAELATCEHNLMVQEQLLSDAKSKVVVQAQPNYLTYRTLQELELRVHMTKGSAVISTIPQGAKVKVVESFFEDKWKVIYNGNEGWIDTKFNTDIFGNGEPTVEKV